MEINALLIIVIIIFAVFMILGFMRGILGIVFGVLSWVFFFVFVNWASPQVCENLRGTEIERGIYEHVYAYLEEKTAERTASIEESISGSVDTKKLKDDIFFQYGLRIPEEFFPEDIDGILKDNDLVKSGIDSTKEGLIAEVSVIVTSAILKGVSTIISALIALVICLAAFIAIKLIAKAPMLGSANRAVGLVFGAFEGLMIVWVVMYVIAVFGASEFGQNMMAQIDSNMVLRFLYDHNQILAFAGL